MYYTVQTGNHACQRSWVRSWDGMIIESSPVLKVMVGCDIETFTLYCKDRCRPFSTHLKKPRLQAAHKNSIAPMAGA